MTYQFRATQEITVTGEVEAESESEAKAIIERISADGDNNGNVIFKNRESVDYFDATGYECIEVDDITAL